MINIIIEKIHEIVLISIHLSLILIFTLREVECNKSKSNFALRMIQNRDDCNDNFRDFISIICFVNLRDYYNINNIVKLRTISICYKLIYDGFKSI